MRIWPALAGLLLVLASPLGMAHKLAPSLLEIRATSPDSYQVLWVTGPGAYALSPDWPADCRGGPITRRQQDSRLEQSYDLSCRAGLAGRWLGIDGLAQSAGLVLLRWEDAGSAMVQDVLTVDRPGLHLPSAGASGPVGLRYLKLGVTHILAGADHLLLVLGLFLLSTGWTRLLMHITAFTLGHSLTLALATLGHLRVPADWAELAIAATLLLMALGLARPRAGMAGHRYALLFVGFGLIHGLGFAGALGEIGLPDEALALALLCFNLGIEFGQIGFVAVLGGLALVLRHGAPTLLPWARMGGIYVLGSLGWFWCLERGWPLLA